MDDKQKLRLDITKILREDFVQQDLDPAEANQFCPPLKTALMLKAILFYESMAIKSLDKHAGFLTALYLHASMHDIRNKLARMKWMPQGRDKDLLASYPQLEQEIRSSFALLDEEIGDMREL